MSIVGLKVSIRKKKLKNFILNFSTTCLKLIENKIRIYKKLLLEIILTSISETLISLKRIFIMNFPTRIKSIKQKFKQIQKYVFDFSK